jgi:hypothetical protein
VGKLYTNYLKSFSRPAKQKNPRWAKKYFSFFFFYYFAVLALRVQVNEFPLLKAKCIQEVMLSEESAGPIQNLYSLLLIQH